MFIYDPAAICASELPIAARARRQDESWRLWHFDDAKSFCAALLKMRGETPFDFTPDEWQSIALVAGGGVWPVPDRPYTNEDWHRDGDFSAAPGQEVTDEIYEYMFEVLPAFRLPRCQRTEEYSGGFMVSEPVTFHPISHKEVYSAFGKSGGKCYFIGLLP